MSSTEIRRARPAMGTMLQIVARAEDENKAGQAVEDALAAVEQVDQLMSFHAEDSELSRLNCDASRKPQSVHPWTYAVLKRATQVSVASGGLFDITVAPLLVECGLLPGHGNGLPEWRRWRHLKLLSNGRVFFEEPMLLDLGGIAKGFAVDQAIHALRRGGCTDATVNAGGDLRRFGREPEVIHLRHGQGLVPVAQLRCGAMATSSCEEASPDRLEQPIGCIMDPVRGQRWRGRGSVTVAARTCMIADALTKVAALAGPASEPVLARFGAQARWDGEDA
ncbi:MAG: FAD:protein FMN transferase [Betaproteobacteria bacterium]|nr:FAD:protein FMN transferase [Betaproteobacteria bacterium]